jgi:hypothetical protein
MYKNFNLTDEERKQIMEMHQSHGYKTPIINEQLMSNTTPAGTPLGVPGWNQFAPKLQSQTKPDISCVDVSLFTQTGSEGKKYYAYDIPGSVAGSGTERIVLYNDGKGSIIAGGATNNGNWMCGANGVEFRSDANPKSIRYLGKVGAPAAANQNTQNQNVTVNCAASLDEIKQGSLKILKHGCKTDAVKKLQEMLGMPTNHQTGFFGNITKAKVIEFQKANKDAEGKDLVVDGRVGDKTYNALVKAKTPESTPAPATTGS